MWRVEHQRRRGRCNGHRTHGDQGGWAQVRASRLLGIINLGHAVIRLIEPAEQLVNRTAMGEFVQRVIRPLPVLVQEKGLRRRGRAAIGTLPEVIPSKSQLLLGRPPTIELTILDDLESSASLVA